VTNSATRCNVISCEDKFTRYAACQNSRTSSSQRSPPRRGSLTAEPVRPLEPPPANTFRRCRSPLGVQSSGCDQSSARSSIGRMDVGALDKARDHVAEVGPLEVASEEWNEVAMGACHLGRLPTFCPSQNAGRSLPRCEGSARFGLRSDERSRRSGRGIYFFRSTPSGFVRTLEPNMIGSVLHAPRSWDVIPHMPVPGACKRRSVTLRKSFSPRLFPSRAR